MHQVKPPETEKELLNRCDDISGRTILELAQNFNMDVPKNSTSAKGWMGQFLEYVLGATAKSKPEPDFEYLGIELKTIPVSLNFKPIESTYICSINLQNLTNVSWENSLVKKKLSKVLWVPIVNVSPNIAQKIIGTPILWSPNAIDEKIIKNDWQELIDLLTLGQIEEVQGSFGEYLQIRPKAANSKSRCSAINKDGMKQDTLPRGFYLRALFTEKIIQANYLS